MDLLLKLYNSNFRNRLLALGILPMHLVVWWGEPGNLLSYLLLGLHVAAFILWHPFWLGESYLRIRSSVLIGVIGIAIVLSQSSLLLAAWIATLASLLAGEPFRLKRDIVSQILSITYLLILLFFAVLPRSFSLEIPGMISTGANYGSLALLIGIASIGTERKLQNIRQVDVLLSMIFLLVEMVIALATITLVIASQSEYLKSLLIVFACSFLAILAINIIWKTFSGTSAVSFLWNRYLLIIGSPFETLLVKFSALAKTTQSPSQYLETCFMEMKQLEWVDGIHWRASSGRGTVGTDKGHQLDVELADLTVTIYAKQEIQSGLAIHARLIIHLITHFYHSIKRERSQAHRAHVQALYETGARLTHDIKNLLQGLKTLAAAGEHTTDPVAFHALFNKQMPNINERLETTLRKLTEPNKVRRDKDVKLSEWWQQLEQRYQGRQVELESHIELDRAIPVEMFNTVSENLLENARAKRLNNRHIEIKAEVTSNSDGLVFSVTDTGHPVDHDKAQFLLSEPVKSEQGLGVGLYQAAALAKHQGYSLILETNIDGLVCFILTNEIEP